LEIPEETEHHEYFESHQGLIYFFGEDPNVVRDLLKHQEDLDFYV